MGQGTCGGCAALRTKRYLSHTMYLALLLLLASTVPLTWGLLGGHGALLGHGAEQVPLNMKVSTLSLFSSTILDRPCLFHEGVPVQSHGFRSQAHMRVSWTRNAYESTQKKMPSLPYRMELLLSGMEY